MMHGCPTEQFNLRFGLCFPKLINLKGQVGALKLDFVSCGRRVFVALLPFLNYGVFFLTSEPYILQKAPELDKFKELLSIGDVAGRTHPVVILKFFCHASLFEVSLLEEVWGYANRCHSIHPFVMPEQGLLPAS
jgi:hypothetical protein